MQRITLKNIGKLTALTTFVLGSLLFIVFHFFRSQTTFHLFVWYLFIAASVNFLVIVSLIIPKDRKQNFGTIGLMFINVPVTFFLLVWFVVVVVNSLRVDFVNKTGSEISDIRIYGCDTKHIDKMKPGETRTLWFRITNDCSLTTNYLKDGERFQETVVHSATSGLGGRATYYMGELNPLYFHH